MPAPVFVLSRGGKEQRWLGPVRGLAPHEREDAEWKRHLQICLHESRLDRVCRHAGALQTARQLVSEEDVGELRLVVDADLVVAADALQIIEVDLPHRLRA